MCSHFLYLFTHTYTNTNNIIPLHLIPTHFHIALVCALELNCNAALALVISFRAIQKECSVGKSTRVSKHMYVHTNTEYDFRTIPAKQCNSLQSGHVHTGSLQVRRHLLLTTPTSRKTHRKQYSNML